MALPGAICCFYNRALGFGKLRFLRALRLRETNPIQRRFYELSLVGSTQSNGLAERAAQRVEGELRTRKDAFEKRTGTIIFSIVEWTIQRRLQNFVL